MFSRRADVARSFRNRLVTVQRSESSSAIAGHYGKKLAFNTLSLWKSHRELAVVPE